MTAWLSLLGIARRAGAVIIGEEGAAEAVQGHKARLILLAADAGDNTANRVRRLEGDKLPVVQLPDNKAELGGAVGFAGVAVVTVTDLGFAAAITAKLAAVDEGCKAVAEELNARQSKALRRKADTMKNGKKSKRRKP